MLWRVNRDIYETDVKIGRPICCLRILIAHAKSPQLFYVLNKASNILPTSMTNILSVFLTNRLVNECQEFEKFIKMFDSSGFYIIICKIMKCSMHCWNFYFVNYFQRDQGWL